MTSSKDKVIKVLADTIVNRRPPKLLKEVQVMVKKNGQQDHPGNIFWKKSCSSLENLSRKHNIPLGQFLLGKIPPLKIEESSEDEDELIKVFVKNKPEPSPLVEIDYSVINAFKECYYQTFRLYVVYDDTVSEDTLIKLQQKVKDWDQA